MSRWLVGMLLMIPLLGLNAGLAQETPQPGADRGPRREFGVAPFIRSR